MAWYDITIMVNGEWLIEIRTISDNIIFFIVSISFIIIISIHIYISSTVHIDIYSIQYIIICAHGQCVADVHLCCDIDQWYAYHTSFIIISILLFFYNWLLWYILCAEMNIIPIECSLYSFDTSSYQPIWINTVWYVYHHHIHFKW